MRKCQNLKAKENPRYEEIKEKARQRKKKCFKQKQYEFISGKHINKYNRKLFKKIYSFKLKKPKKIYPSTGYSRAEWYKIQYQNNPGFRLNSIMRKTLAECLKGSKNNRKWQDLVGYTKDDLMKYLEKQFKNKYDWNGYGKEWELDHVIPLNNFNITTAECIDFKRAWSLKNLRPLDCHTNRSRKRKVIGFQPGLI